MKITAVPPVAAAAPSPQAQACQQAVAGYRSLAGMCAAGHTTVAPLVAGLFDALKGQFGTASGVLSNVLFFLFGLLTSVATGGVGLILKLIGLVGMSWGLWKMLSGVYSAARDYVSAPAGSPQKAAALRRLGVAGGGLLIMVLMAVGGWGLGKTRAGAGATQALEGGMQTALDKTGLSGVMATANAALAPVAAWLGKLLPAPAAGERAAAVAAEAKPGEVGKVVDPELYRRYRDAADKYGQDPDLIVAHMEAQGRGFAVPHDRVGHILQEGPTCAACSIANASRLPTSDVPRLVRVLGEGPKASDVFNVTRQLGGKVVAASEIEGTVHDGHPVIVALKIGREAQHAIVIDGVFSHDGQTFYSATDSNFGHRLFFPEASFDKMAATGGVYFPDGIDRATLAKLEPLPTDRPAGGPAQPVGFQAPSEPNLAAAAAKAEAEQAGANPEQAEAAAKTAEALAKRDPATAAAARDYRMDDNKFTYFFGKATGDPKNVLRSQQIARVLAENGIHDTPSGREELRALIDLASRAEPLKAEARQYGEAVVKPVQLPTAQLQVTFFYEPGSPIPKVTTIIPRELPKRAAAQ